MCADTLQIKTQNEVKRIVASNYFIELVFKHSKEHFTTVSHLIHSVMYNVYIGT